MSGGPSAAGVRRAAARLAGVTLRTPCVRYPELDAALGAAVWLKCEFLQRTGAFKLRGAWNALAAELEAGREVREVVTFSSGNHGRAVAVAAADHGLPARVFLPRGASAFKRDAVLAAGAQVVETATRREAEEAVAEAAREPGVLAIPPFDHDEVVHGQGTAVLEALADVAESGGVDAVFTPLGGGGLLSGSALAAAAHEADGGRRPAVFGGEPARADDGVRSLREGRLVVLDEQPETLADGARTLSLAPRTLAVVRSHANGVWRIEEADLARWAERLPSLLGAPIEPTAVLGLAAADRWLAGEPPDGPTDLAAPPPPDRPAVLVVLSGGNVAG